MTQTTAKRVLEIKPSDTSSVNDFDFLIGTWKVANRKLKTRLEHCDDWIEFEATVETQKILNGNGNFETFKDTFDDEPFEGMAVRLFNPRTRLWSIYWADSNSVTLDENPVVGSFDGSVGKFLTKDTFAGKEITVLYQWDKTDPLRPIWSQAFSLDEGRTWEWNWYMRLSPGRE